MLAQFKVYCKANIDLLDMELKTLKRKASDSKHGAWSPFESSMVLGSKEVRERLLDSGGTSGGVSVNDLNVIGAAIATAERTPWECPAAPAKRSRSSLGANPDTRQTTRYWISCEA
jgi:hypothetical protein